MIKHCIAIILSALVFVSLATAQLDDPQVDQLLENGKFSLSNEQPDSAAIYFQAAKNLLAPQFEIPHADIKYADLNIDIGYIYRKARAFDKAIEYYLFAKEIYENQETPNFDKIASLYQSLCSMQTGASNFEEAKIFAKEGLQLEGKIKPENLAKLYNTLGITYYYEKKDYEQALENFEAALRWRRIAFGDNHPKIASSYNNLGVMHLDLFKDYVSALDSYQRAYRIFLELNWENPSDISNTCDNIAEAHARLGNFEQAEIYRKRSLEIREKAFGKISRGTAISYENLGRDLARAERYDEALLYLRKAADIKYRFYGKYHFFTIHAYQYLGNTFSEIGELDSALVYYQQAIISAYRNFEDLNIYNNPNLEEALYDKARMLDVLELKAQTFAKRYDQSKELPDLEASHQTYQLAIKIIDKIREEYERVNSKENLLDRAMPIYEAAIAMNLELSKLTRDKKYLNNIFELMERSKSTLLLESLREDEAKEFAGIPEELLLLEDEVYSQLFNAEQALYKAESKKEVDEIEIAEVKEEMFKLRQRSDSIAQSFKKNYPEYHRLKYDIPLIRVSEAIASFPNDEHTLLEYFVGEKYIYVCILQKSQFDIVELAKDFPLEKWVKTFRKSIVQSTDLSQANAEDTLVHYAHNLYQKLFEPIEKQYKLGEGLTIIPGGILGYLPFEMLIKKPNESASLFNAHNYLIRDYCISYNYSSTLLKEMQEREHRDVQANFLGFAPAFAMTATGARSGNVDIKLANLEYNIPEVEGIQELVGGKVFTAATATKTRFLEAAPDYKIIHLATHGVANDQVGDYAYLAFYETQDSAEQHLLYNRDLYNLKLQSDLVVLSACETGVGELKNGEGIISLARGFSYAGTKSILTTLWNINDAKTQEIMHTFYSYLRAGKSKDEALRQSKLDFLDTYSHSAHPFYWAAFVPVGDMEAISLSEGFSYWWFLILPILIFVMLFLRKGR